MDIETKQVFGIKVIATDSQFKKFAN